MKRTKKIESWLTEEQKEKFQQNKSKVDPAMSDAEFIRYCCIYNFKK